MDAEPSFSVTPFPAMLSYDPVNFIHFQTTCFLSIGGVPIVYFSLYRKTLLLATSVIVAGGTAAYLQSRSCRGRPDFVGHQNELNEKKEQLEEVYGNENIGKTSRQKKKGGLKSLQVLAAMLLSHMGRIGARDLLALVGIVVSLS